MCIDGACSTGARDERCRKNDDCTPGLVCGPEKRCAAPGVQDARCTRADQCAPMRHDTKRRRCFEGACQTGGKGARCAGEGDCATFEYEPGRRRAACMAQWCTTGTVGEACNNDGACARGNKCEGGKCVAKGGTGSACAKERDCVQFEYKEGRWRGVCGDKKCHGGTAGEWCNNDGACAKGLKCRDRKCAAQ